MTLVPLVVVVAVALWLDLMFGFPAIITIAIIGVGGLILAYGWIAYYLRKHPEGGP